MENYANKTEQETIEDLKKIIKMQEETMSTRYSRDHSVITHNNLGQGKTDDGAGFSPYITLYDGRETHKYGGFSTYNFAVKALLDSLYMEHSLLSQEEYSNLVEKENHENLVDIDKLIKETSSTVGIFRKYTASR